jgi:hypothetical protein
MESTGAGKAEDRVKAASPSKTSETSPEKTTSPSKSMGEVDKEYQASRIERFKKIHGKYPRAA